MDDEAIIDLGEYARRKEESAAPERTMFAIWGGEGERTRFALPLWRAACLVGGARAVLAWEGGEARDEVRPLVVLDLAAEPARREVPPERVERLRREVAPPSLGRSEEGVAVFLGERQGRRWYLVVDDLDGSGIEAELGVEDLYFLAGECAGLLFHRDLDGEAGGS